MLIDGENKIYMFDRDHSVFEISHLRFPKDPENTSHLTNTLVDGVNLIVRSFERSRMNFIVGIGHR